MLASQLIYTGCGKDKTGAFSVWSKTLDITRAEETEISEKMRYKRPPNTPFEPTREELETLFPKKMGYFKLSSGRFCLAQSTYVSDVYSDLDQRTGNYVLHAFVFDAGEPIIPMNFIGSDLFRRELTSEEWHADAPAELPRVEIEARPSSLSKQEIDTFFDAQKLGYLKQFLQAVINASGDERKVTFHDAPENLKYWYKAMSVCLPAKMLGELTFNTMFLPGTPLPTQAGAPTVNTEIKIRNIIPTMVLASNFSYQQEAKLGRYAFDFTAGIIPTGIEVSAYVDTAVDTLVSNVFGAVMFVDAVGKIGAKCGVDLNTAADLHCLRAGQIARVDGTDKLKRLLSLLARFYPEDTAAVADHLYDYGIREGNWRMSEEISELYRFIFDHSARADKAEMIRAYIANQSAFGVNRQADCVAYASEFRKKAPFAWASFSGYLLDAVASGEYASQNGDSFAARYLVFDTFVDAISAIAENKEQRSVAVRYFAETAKDCVRGERFEELSALIECISRAGKKWESWLLEKSVLMLCPNDAPITNAASPAFLLRLCEANAGIPITKDFLSRLIAEKRTDAAFVKLYVDRCDKNSAFYSALPSAFKEDAVCTAFFRSVELYRFEVSPTVTKELLQRYYTEYFAKGADKKGLFAQKLQVYLSSLDGKDRLNECLLCYDRWMRDEKVLKRELEPCVKIICDAFFALSPALIRQYIAQRGTQKTEELLAAAPDGYRAPLHYSVTVFGEGLSKLAEKLENKSPIAERTEEKILDGGFYTALPKEERARELFLEEYFGEVLRIYLALVTDANFASLFASLVKPFYACTGFHTALVNGLERFDEKKYELLLGDLIICACVENSKLGDYLLPVVESILDGMNRGKRKKFFQNLQKSLPAQYEKSTNAFIARYLKEHESFFEKVFGGGRSKHADEDEDTDGKKEEKGKKKSEDKSDRKARDAQENKKWKK